MYNLILVDDHKLVSDTLKSYIESFEDFHVVSQLYNGKALVNFLKSSSKPPDLILLDINMPIMNGIDTMKWINENMPDQKVIALSMDDNEKTIIQMLRLGVNAYIVKDCNPLEFKTALYETMENGQYYSARVANCLILNLNSGKDIKNLNLKDREIEFLNFACSELTYKEIAAKMYLSPKTIDGYRESVFSKLGVKSRVGMVMYAINNKLVEQPSC